MMLIGFMVLLGLTIFGLILFGMPAALLGLIPFPYVFIGTVVLCSIGLVFAFIAFLLIGNQGRKDVMLDSIGIWKKVFGGNTDVVLVPGEKIVFPATSCYYSVVAIAGFGFSANDFVVTDQRIIKRTLDMIGLFGHPSERWISLVPETNKTEFPRMMAIKKIEYLGDDADPTMKIEIQTYIGSRTWNVHHSEAKKIVGMFKGK